MNRNSEEYRRLKRIITSGGKFVVRPPIECRAVVLRPTGPRLQGRISDNFNSIETRFSRLFGIRFGRTVYAVVRFESYAPDKYFYCIKITTRVRVRRKSKGSRQTAGQTESPAGGFAPTRAHCTIRGEEERGGGGGGGEAAAEEEEEKIIKIIRSRRM